MSEYVSKGSSKSVKPGKAGKPGIENYHSAKLNKFITFMFYIDELIQKLNLSYTSIRDLITIVDHPGITSYKIVRTFNLSTGTLRALQKRLNILKLRGLIFSDGKYLYPTESALKSLGRTIPEKILPISA